MIVGQSFVFNHFMNNNRSLTPGILILCLVLFLCIGSGCGKTDPQNPSPTPTAIKTPEVIPPPEIAKSSSVFFQLKIQEAHKNYAKAYLDLIERINTFDKKNMKEKDQKLVFSEYQLAMSRYRDVVKKINEYEKEGREKCFSIMRSLVSAVSVYDKMSQKKMFKFDVQKLIEKGILKEPPKCPRDGEYSIFYKDGRRVFRCSAHGTLKQK